VQVRRNLVEEFNYSLDCAPSVLDCRQTSGMSTSVSAVFVFLQQQCLAVTTTMSLCVQVMFKATGRHRGGHVSTVTYCMCTDKCVVCVQVMFKATGRHRGGHVTTFTYCMCTDKCVVCVHCPGDVRDGRSTQRSTAQSYAGLDINR